MIRKNKQSVSVWFFVALGLACIFLWAAIQNNREIDERRLVEPVQTTGTLTSSRCTTWMRGAKGAGPKPEAVLEYKYTTIDTNPSSHILVATKWFDTLKDCAEFEKTNSATATIWYEKGHPEKASLIASEEHTWGFLYGEILAVLFAILGVYDQKSINQEKHETQKLKRATNRLKRKRKP